MGDVIKIDQETLKTQDTPLSDEQNEAIALAAIAEVDDDGKEKKAEEPEKKEEKPEKGEEKPEENAPPAEDTVLSDEELLSAEDDKLSDAQKTKKAELVDGIEKEKVRIKAEEDTLVDTKDEELSEEDKVKKADIVKTRGEASTQAAEAEVKEYATEHKVTEEEARTDIESIGKIQEKYKDDPKQLAKANLHLQRLYSKLEKDAKAQVEAKPVQEVTVEAVEKYLADGKATMDGKPVTKEMTIEAYKKAYPELTENLEDEKIFKLAAKEYKQNIDKANAHEKSQVSVKAQEKRSTLYESIPEEDKKFIPDVKTLVEKLSDAQIASDGFDVNTYLQYVMGAVYKADIKKSADEKKEFGAKEYKRGLQEAKIIGLKRTPDGGPPKSKSKATLTDAQKKRALEMYEATGITEETAFDLYRDYIKDEKKD